MDGTSISRRSLFGFTFGTLGIGFDSFGEMRSRSGMCIVPSDERNQRPLRTDELAGRLNRGRRGEAPWGGFCLSRDKVGGGSGEVKSDNVANVTVDGGTVSSTGSPDPTRFAPSACQKAGCQESHGEEFPGRSDARTALVLEEDAVFVRIRHLPHHTMGKSNVGLVPPMGHYQ